MCLIVDLLDFVKLPGCVNSCLLSNLESSWPLFYQIFILFLFSLFIWDSYFVYVSPLGGIPQVSCLLGSVDFFLCSFFSFCSLDWIISIDLLWVCSFYLLPAHICCRNSSMNFSFQLLCFSFSYCVLVHFYNFYLFIDILFLLN